MMMIRVNLARMETVNAQRAAGRRGRPTLHPIAEYYGDWERQRERERAEQGDGSLEMSLNGGGDA